MEPSRENSQPESTAAPAEEPPAADTGAADEERRQEAGGEDEEESNENENEALIFKAQALMDKITANAENPNPNTLHALSSLLENEESRYTCV